MKYVMLLVLALSLTSCLDGNSYTPPRVDSKSLQKNSPEGLIFKESCGINWWYGEYRGKKVLIQAINNQAFYTISFQYIEQPNMTVREDMLNRMKLLEEKDLDKDFGARIVYFGIQSAMSRMTEEELNRELEEDK